MQWWKSVFVAVESHSVTVEFEHYSVLSIRAWNCFQSRNSPTFAKNVQNDWRNGKICEWLSETFSLYRL